MATSQEILEVSGHSYPSWVRGGNWVDLNRSVRVVDNAGKNQVICLLDPVAGMAILTGGTGDIPIKDLVISKRQGRVNGPEIAEEALDVLQQLLNTVADERTPNPNPTGPRNVQTPNAAAARMLLGIFCMPREKGLVLNWDAIRKLRV